MKTITIKEAQSWVSRMTPEQIVEIVREYHALKQGLCAQVLCVPTGAADWVDRAIHKAFRLAQTEHAIRKLVYTVEIACAEARVDSRETSCTNCMGRGANGDESCCVCRGTGLRQLT